MQRKERTTHRGATTRGVDGHKAHGLRRNGAGCFCSMMILQPVVPMSGAGKAGKKQLTSHTRFTATARATSEAPAAGLEQLCVSCLFPSLFLFLSDLLFRSPSKFSKVESFEAEGSSLRKLGKTKKAGNPLRLFPPEMGKGERGQPGGLER